MPGKQVDSPLSISHIRVRSHSRTSSNESSRRAHKRSKTQPDIYHPIGINSPIGPDIFDNPIVNSGSTTTERPPKRTRTGCRTCRERHLKCDERRPECGQCLKGKRACSYERFLKWDKHIDRREIPYEVPIPFGNPFGIKDESVAIASEYVGGEDWYASHEKQRRRTDQEALRNPDQPSAQHVSSGSRPFGSWPTTTTDGNHRQVNQPQTRVPSEGTHKLMPNGGHLSTILLGLAHHEGDLQSAKYSLKESQKHPMVANPIEAHFLNVFIEEMGSWMDMMNSNQYVSFLSEFASPN